MSERGAQTVLGYLADLAPTGGRTTEVVTREAEFAWLGGSPDHRFNPDLEAAVRLPKTDQLKRLVAVDSLSPTEDLLRLGWLFLAGTVDGEGGAIRYCMPLLSVPVKLRSFLTWYQVAHEGTLEMPDDLFDWDTRLEFETSVDAYAEGVRTDSNEAVEQLPRLAEWVAAVLSRTDLPSATLRGGDTNPLDLRSTPGLHVVVGTAVYASRDLITPNSAGILTTWSHQPVTDTALWAMYRDDQPPEPVAEENSHIASPLPLNKAQREALRRTKSEPIVAVSGPPGTGKSHLVAAAAIDQVARGHSVLVATQSHYAASVIADLLERYPGPRFVRFGNRGDRESVAAELGDGLAQPMPREKHEDLKSIADASAQDLERIHKWISRLLRREVDFNRGLQRRAVARLAAVDTPGVLDDDFDLGAAESLMQRAREGIPPFRAWARRRAEKRLRRLVRCAGSVTLDGIETGLDAARAEEAVKQGLAEGGLSLLEAWREYESAEEEHRRIAGRLIEAARRSRENSKRRSTRAVATLASALRAGRARRRQLLQELDADDFLDVLPLWVGTLQEIDDTLPVVPGAFDLVIFDEASQIDQMRAAPALARAQRAMVVGDPRQLRHVSFVSDDAMREAAESAGLGPELSRLLDVRRNSLFDIGAAASEVTWLDEHFRCVPHIIRFSDRAFYGGNLRLMTQHPRNETRDAIHTIRVSGTRGDQGVNLAEVDEVMRQITRYAASGATSIGVISPFRPQADALEEAILAAYGPEDIDRLGLRSGTVHAFQGSERDVVIASLAVDDGAGGGSLNFLQNPNLFNVLVTRAKREMVVVTSVDESILPAGLLADYLRHAEHAPRGMEAATPGDEWTQSLMSELQGYGIPIVASYKVAGWAVDLAVGEAADAIGVETAVHPDGPESHIEQHLALRRAGWDMADAFQSRWLTDATGAAEMLSKRLLRR